MEFKPGKGAVYGTVTLSQNEEIRVLLERHANATLLIIRLYRGGQPTDEQVSVTADWISNVIAGVTSVVKDPRSVVSLPKKPMQYDLRIYSKVRDGKVSIHLGEWALLTSSGPMETLQAVSIPIPKIQDLLDGMKAAQTARKKKKEPKNLQELLKAHGYEPGYGGYRPTAPRNEDESGHE